MNTQLNANRNRKSISLWAALALIILIALAFSASAASGNNPERAGLVERPVQKIASAQPMSPSESLFNGKPTLIYLYADEHCQYRYCLSPQVVAYKLSAEYGDSVNYVPLRMLTHPNGELLPIENWDLYPVEPYGTWLETILKAEAQTSLAQVLLVDADGQLVFQGDEFFSWKDLAPHIDSTGAAKLNQALPVSGERSTFI